MRLLITGGSGYVGGFLVDAAVAAGDAVTLLGRRPPPVAYAGRVDWHPFDLEAVPDRLPTADALIHAAFDHVPGKYRGGEGADAEGFLRRNLEGSRRLFVAATGVSRIVFLSSRAVYGTHAPGTVLSEDLTPQPDTLYGQMKYDVEQDLAGLSSPSLTPVSLRATGVYGQSGLGMPHKWSGLFAQFERGEAIAPRQGTEVHGADLAQAVHLCLTAPSASVAGRVFNVSDLLIDRHDLLAEYARIHGLEIAPPAPTPPPAPNAMTCAPLSALGWRPRGLPGLRAFLTGIAAGVSGV